MPLRVRKPCRRITPAESDGPISTGPTPAWIRIFSEMTITEGCALSEPLVRKAIALDQDDTEVRARLALTALLKGDLEDAVAEAEQVLSVDESCAGALGVKGAALVYSGNREEGRH